MHLRQSLAAAASLVLISLATTAGAEVLWDQSNWDLNNGTIDLSSNSCSQISGNTKVHVANDVHFDSPVRITTVRIYETTGTVEGATQALLWIHPKNSVMPTTVSDSLELASLLVNINSVNETVGANTRVRVTAAGLDIELPAGDYWVSLTPRHNYGGTPPYSYHLVTTSAVIGDPSAAIVACTSNSTWTYPLAPSLYDYSIKIEGEVHRPTVQAATGQRGEVPGP
jgi:hypothetical protein